jgi:hypothetical protein
VVRRKGNLVYLIGWVGEQSILAYRSLDETEDLVFALLDRRRGTAY